MKINGFIHAYSVRSMSNESMPGERERLITVPYMHIAQINYVPMTKLVTKLVSKMLHKLAKM